jgi:hypothetical protein
MRTDKTTKRTAKMALPHFPTSPLLQLMDELIAHESDQTFEYKHDENTEREGDMEQ